MRVVSADMPPFYAVVKLECGQSFESPTSTGSGCSAHAELRLHPRLHVAGELHDIGRGRVCRGSRSRACAWHEIAAPEPGSANPRSMPALLDQPRGAELDLVLARRRAVAGGDLGAEGQDAGRLLRLGRVPRCVGRQGAAKVSLTIGLVKKDPALIESGSAGFQTIPLLARSASTASRTSASGTRVAELDAERRRELRVGDRVAQPAVVVQLELERRARRRGGRA